jgi:transposase
MLEEAAYGQVYLAAGYTDMRKSIDGLAVLVKERFKLDPFSNCLFVFCNRNRDKLKILHWEHNGFWLFYRRLEEGKFEWPAQGDPMTAISRRELLTLGDKSVKNAEMPAK